MTYHITGDGANDTPPAETVFDQLVRLDHKDRMLHAALWYGMHGIPVFPAKIVQDPVDPKKVIKKSAIEGFLNGAATTDLDQIGTWWKRDFIGYAIGTPTGRLSGWGALDVDVKNGGKGLASLTKLADELIPVPTRTELAFGQLLPEERLAPVGLARTRSGGLHLWWPLGEHAKLRSRNKIPGLPGIEFKSTGSFVVLPPSDGYEWIKQLPEKSEAETPTNVYLASLPVINEALLARVLQGRDMGLSGGDGDECDDDGTFSVVRGKGRELLDDTGPTVARAPHGEGNDTIYQCALDLYAYVVLGELTRGQVDDAIMSGASLWEDEASESSIRATLNSAWDRVHRRKYQYYVTFTSLSDESVTDDDDDSGDVTDQVTADSSINQPEVEDTAVSTNNVDAASPAASSDGDDEKATFAVLPDEFWKARPVLAHIRQAAWSRMQRPDVALHAVLTRIAAIVSPRIRADSGISDPASLNYYAAVIGSSGDGKTQSVKVAKALVKDTGILGPRNDVSIGSGEGLVETFMGEVKVMQTTVDSETGKFVQKERTERGQEHHNAWFYQDEGEQLMRIDKRHGSTLGGVVRSAWNGETLGQQNATAERRRRVVENTYSLGIVIGFQPEVVQDLLAEYGTGFPQRFCWCAAVDPSIPDEIIEWPGELPWDPEVLAVPETADDDVIIQFAPDIKAELRRDHLARSRGQLEIGPFDGQRPLMLVKLAALLALLDSRNDKVTWEDWDLANVIYDTSSKIRDALVKEVQERRKQEAKEKDDRQMYLAVRTKTKIDEVDASAKRIAKRLAGWVHDAEDKRLTRSNARRRIHKDSRGLFIPAINYAESMNWIVVEDDNSLKAGSSVPVE